MRQLKIAVPAVAIIALIIGTFALAQQNTPGNGVTTTLENTIFPRARIFEFNGDVAQLDTSTGAVLKFSGKLANPNARGTFRLFVRPVDETTSGFLQIQQAGGATFLVDEINGTTWILRQRGGVAIWDEVQTVGL